MKNLKTFENFINEQSQSNLLDYFKNIWSKDISLQNKIMTDPTLFKKYSLYLLKNFDWESLSEDELNQLWIDWSNDENEN